MNVLEVKSMNNEKCAQDIKIAVLDIGGTLIKSGIFHNGSLNEVKESDTNSSCGGEHVINGAKEILKSYGDFDGIGISIAGQVDFAKGMPNI